MATTTPTIRHPMLEREEAPRSPSLLYRLTQTDARLAPAIARVVLGLVIFPHSAQKWFGWFGGQGLSGTISAFSGMMPAPLAIVAIVTELVSCVALVLGLFTRLAALGIIAVMAGAIYFVHWPNGFFMNWAGQQAGEGFEYHLLAIALALVGVLAGGGVASIDRALMKRRRV